MIFQIFQNLRIFGANLEAKELDFGQISSGGGGRGLGLGLGFRRKVTMGELTTYPKSLIKPKL